MSFRRALLVLAAASPLLAWPWLGARAADALGGRIGRELGRAAPRLVSESAGQRRSVSPVPALPVASAASPQAEPPRPKPARRDRKAPAEAPAGVHLDADAVLALAERGVMPGAESVPASASRPAGLRLRGVSALGVGLKDGDVLSDVAGRPVGSVAEVVGLIAGQRSRRVPVISGRIWRGDRPLTLSVEQPYSWKKPAALLADSRHRG